MKKIISIILLFTLVFSCFALWGCNSNKSRVPLKNFFDEYVAYDRIYVTVKLDEAILPASFFGEKIVKEVIAYYDYTQTRIYCLRLNSKNALDLIYCVRKIESIDEVLGVSLYKTAFPLDDDSWYLSSTDDEVGQWALEAIDIEKVWDFRKYK